MVSTPLWRAELFADVKLSLDAMFTTNFKYQGIPLMVEAIGAVLIA